ncbi:MAG: hypothetical protein GX594_10010 [Pirellulaceae bacterium]|nr:hypothetical protein [Pirellulaceae bacterium]
MSMDNFGMPAVEPEVVGQRRGWWSRNWLWFVPTVFLLLIIFCCGCPVGFFFYRYRELLDKPYVLDALRKVHKNEQIRKEIGNPIIISLMPPPTIVESDRNADLRGELQGPEGKAKVHVQARKMNDKWGLVVLEVWLPSGEKVSLADEIEGVEDAPPFEGAAPPGEMPPPDAPPPSIDMPMPDVQVPGGA